MREHRRNTARDQYTLSTAQELKKKLAEKINIRRTCLGIALLIFMLTITNKKNCTGVYDKMRVLEVAEGDASELLGHAAEGAAEAAAEGERKTYSKEEEEALLADSEGEGAERGTDPAADLDAEMHSDEEEERRREREAELADMLQMNKEREERMKRRKMEREKRRTEMAMKEAALRDAERDRIRAEIEAEKQAEIDRLEKELRKARAESESQAGSGKGEKRKLEGQQRDRAGSQESRNESVASSAIGANVLNLPAGYRAIRSSKISSLAVRHLNGGAAIPFKPIGSFANDADARIRLANTISDATSLRNISSSFNIENFVCNTCTVRGEHQVLGKKSEGNDGPRQSPPPVSFCRTRTFPR